MRGLFIVVCVLVSMTATAQQKVGSTGEFLGWHPKSETFAYTLTTRSHYEPTRVTSFMKRVTKKGTRAQRLAYAGSVRERIRAEKFVLPPAIRGHRTSDYVQSFALTDFKRLRVVLDVGSKRLGYTVWLDDLDGRQDNRRLIGGWFDELWTGLDARVFPSPNGEWVAIVLTMETNFRTLTWVEGVHVGVKK